MKISIELKGGRWLVNNKQLSDCSPAEQDFMNRFFQELKESELLKNKPNE